MKLRAFLATLLLYCSSAPAIEINAGTGLVTFTGTLRNIDVTAGVKYPVMSFIDVGLDLTFASQRFEDTSISGLTAILGPNFTFGGKNDAIFITLGLGWRKMSGETANTVAVASTTTTTTGTEVEEVVDPNGTGFALVGGKKIPLFGALSLRPTVGILYIREIGVYFNPLYLAYQF